MENNIKDYIHNIQENISSNDLQLKIKMVKKRNLHISLKFLGDLNSLEIEKTLLALQKVSFKITSFNINLSKNIEAFPNFEKPRVLWIGLEEGKEELRKIYNAIEHELVDESFYVRDKLFTPHITLGRIKYIKYPSQLKEIREKLEYKDILQNIKSIIFMESNLTSKGPVYNIISQFPFLQ